MHPEKLQPMNKNISDYKHYWLIASCWQTKDMINLPLVLFAYLHQCCQGRFKYHKVSFRINSNGSYVISATSLNSFNPYIYVYIYIYTDSYVIFKHLVIDILSSFRCNCIEVYIKRLKLNHISASRQFTAWCCHRIMSPVKINLCEL